MLYLGSSQNKLGPRLIMNAFEILQTTLHTIQKNKAEQFDQHRTVYKQPSINDIQCLQAISTALTQLTLDEDDDAAPYLRTLMEGTALLSFTVKNQFIGEDGTSIWSKISTLNASTILQHDNRIVASPPENTEPVTMPLYPIDSNTQLRILKWIIEHSSDVKILCDAMIHQLKAATSKRAPLSKLKDDSTLNIHLNNLTQNAPLDHWIQALQAAQASDHINIACKRLASVRLNQPHDWGLLIRQLMQISTHAPYLNDQAAQADLEPLKKAALTLIDYLKKRKLVSKKPSQLKWDKIRDQLAHLNCTLSHFEQCAQAAGHCLKDPTLFDIASLGPTPSQRITQPSNDSSCTPPSSAVSESKALKKLKKLKIRLCDLILALQQARQRTCNHPYHPSIVAFWLTELGECYQRIKQQAIFLSDPQELVIAWRNILMHDDPYVHRHLRIQPDALLSCVDSLRASDLELTFPATAPLTSNTFKTQEVIQTDSSNSQHTRDHKPPISRP